MKIAVTGCSWSCRDLDLPDIEFGQLVSDYYNSEYVNIAKPACSNAGIAMQIDYICNGGIGEKPDLVIINATTVTRSELKLLNDKRFDASKSWDNVAYNMLFGEKFRDEHAPGYNKGYDPTIVVDSFATIFGEDLTKKLGDGHFHDRYVDAFTPKSYEIYKQWFLYFFDADIERYKQQLILMGAMYKLTANGIPFIFCPNTFDWGEDLFLSSKKKETQEYPISPVEWTALPAENLLYSGIAESLYLAEDVYGSWDKSPGHYSDNHLPVECHMDFAQKVITHINRYNLAK